MFHKSELGEHATGFPHDTAGYVPRGGDHWRQMKFEHGAMDPEEEGISAEERLRRIEYLDQVWWPQILEKVSQEHDRLVNEHGESYLQRWQRVVNRSPDQPGGFEVEPS